MPKLKIINNLKEKLKNIPIIHFGKRESLKPEPLVPQKPRPDIEPPKPVKPPKVEK